MNGRGKRVRLDRLLADRELFGSRTAAAKAVRAGQVQLGRDGPIALRPSEPVFEGQEIILLGGPEFVSRGGTKLSNALATLELDVAGKRCLDVGASTGGFTDCLLQRGASEVIALDVAYGQLDLSIREDARVTVVERANARAVRQEDLPFRPDLVVIDVSFISLGKVLPAIREVVAPGGEVLAMVKPQFELGKGRVGRGGVVRDPGERREAVERVAEDARSIGFVLLGVAPTDLPGPKGNRETFLRLGTEGRGVASGAALCEGVDL